METPARNDWPQILGVDKSKFPPLFNVGIGLDWKLFLKVFGTEALCVEFVMRSANSSLWLRRPGLELELVVEGRALYSLEPLWQSTSKSSGPSVQV